MKTLAQLLLTICLPFSIYAAPPFAKWTDKTLTLNNSVVERTIKLPSEGGHFYTNSYKPVTGEYRYFDKESPEFEFVFDNISYSGLSDWTLSDIKTISDTNMGDGAAVKLISLDKKIEVTISYLLYPNSPAIRKSLLIKNISGTEASLEAADVEKLRLSRFHALTYSWIYSDYARRKSIGPFEGSRHDALVILHNPTWKEGVVLGNEASGVLKNTSVFWKKNEIVIGLTSQQSAYPFRKWIKSGESFESPMVFTMVYNDRKTSGEILNKEVPDFVRNHMGIRLSELSEKPTFLYNTWHPFKSKIDEKLIRELAKAAAAAGMKEFIIDDGWADNFGDWNVDKKKFPNGLKPVFDYIKSLGMKPGLWISVGSATESSQVFKAHPEWFVKNKEDKYANLHIEGVGDGGGDNIRSACFSTGWKDYIMEVMRKLIVDNGLEYLKLDFSVVTSAYILDPQRSGCYATNHPAHKDHHESMYVNYERMWQLFDEIHKIKNDLFLDCTFEAMGGLQLIDFAMLKHAEGNWMSNFYEADELGDLRVRNMAWWRSPAMSATALVIGNPRMDDKGWKMHIKSLAGTVPIMLGDPRKLNAQDLKTYRSYADWLQKMAEKYDIMSFRQDLPGFGEPQEGSWDGFQRINTDTKQGGIIGVFRHGSNEKRREVVVDLLDPSKLYKVKSFDGKIIATLTGQDLKTKGFAVTIPELYGGELFEIAP